MPRDWIIGVNTDPDLRCSGDVLKIIGSHDRMVQIKKTITFVDKDGGTSRKEIDATERPKQDLSALKFMNVGFYLAVPILLGLFGGIWVDKMLKTKPIFTLIFISLGVIAAFYNLYKLIKDA